MAALTGMQIYKSLPRTNCKDCGFPTCMAFAMQVAAKQKAITDCKHITEDAKASLSDASAPPMKLVTVGAGEKKFVFGQETVMFRHEERFHHPSGIAVRIESKLSDAQAEARLMAIHKVSFERAGERLNAALCAVEVDGCVDPAARAKLIAAKSCIPIILLGTNADKLKTAAEAIASERPCIATASAATLDVLADCAAKLKIPLAVGAETLEEIADLTIRAKARGAEEIILMLAGKTPADTIRQMTIARRAAIKKNFRALGYPTLVEVVAPALEQECVLAASFAVKYGGIVVVNGVDAWELLPVLTTIQNVYTNPQVPNAVEAKLYAIGSVTENSPVLFTTNFSLTYFSVAGEVERSKIPTYISVVPTEGLGVLNAYAGDKISAEKVVKTLQEQKVAEKVKHRKLIIPGLLPIFKGELEDISEWKEVIIGPESASKIPAFLNSIWK
jgi:acetyl-CoA decarbonylase/synthase, CODH/ACS complex subunit gamma